MKNGSSGSETQKFKFNHNNRSPELNSYLNMMGGGPNNYGATIQDQPMQSVNDPAPTTTTTSTANTRYGVWTPGEVADYPGHTGGVYDPVLPWGLQVPYVGDTPWTTQQHISNPNGEDLPLMWDYSTGQVVGGDQQLDAYRSLWKPRLGDVGIDEDALDAARRALGGTHTQWGKNQLTALPDFPSSNLLTLPGINPTMPDWWASANDPNYIQPGSYSILPEGGYSFNPGTIPAGPPISPPTPQPHPTSPPAAFLIRGPGPPVPLTPAAAAGAYGDYGGFPIAGSGGGDGDRRRVEDEMTGASSYGTNPWGFANW